LPAIQDVLDDIVQSVGGRKERGRVAHYIPELATVDPSQFGIAVALSDGSLFEAGDSRVPFSIQSISKVFTLALALGRSGTGLWKRVGREPSGAAFDSIAQLESDKGLPRNPFINSGAIVVTDIVLAGHSPRECLGEILRFVHHLSGDESIHINDRVARSETENGFRNVATANYLRSHGNLLHEVELTLGVYFHQCAIEMSCHQLALAGRFLANGGRLNPSGPRIIVGQSARQINSLMLACGHYNGSGEFAFNVGLPGKSGVGGGIIAVVPGVASIAVWSPGLNSYGNSRLGTVAMERLAKAMDWSIFG